MKAGKYLISMLVAVGIILDIFLIMLIYVFTKNIGVNITFFVLIIAAGMTFLYKYLFWKFMKEEMKEYELIMEKYKEIIE